jgi:hypothetical protein
MDLSSLAAIRPSIRVWLISSMDQSLSAVSRPSYPRVADIVIVGSVDTD